MRLLIIEDEKELAEALERGLTSLGYAVDLAFDGLDGEQKAAATSYDVIILDLNLPIINGIDVCRYLRHSGCTSAILMLTARSQISDRTLGLDTGADDYMVKPFAFDELRARIQALLRRSYGHKNPVISLGKLYIDPAARIARYDEMNIILTAREFDILEYMAYKHPSVVSAEEIMEHIWDDEIDPFSNAVRVHIANLKGKLKKVSGRPVIETIVGVGYKLCIFSD